MGKTTYTVSSHWYDESDTRTFDTKGRALAEARHRQGRAHHDVTTTDSVTDPATRSRASWSR